MKKTLGNILFYSICGLLLIIVLCQVGVFPFRFMYLRSGSMSPTYQPGDVVFLYVGKNIQADIGDVVLFSGFGGVTLHRVVSIGDGLITTKGDANDSADHSQITQVDGKLLFAIPKVGFIVDFIQIPFRWIGQLL